MTHMGDSTSPLSGVTWYSSFLATTGAIFNPFRPKKTGAFKETRTAVVTPCMVS